jgi:hypothetical protein
LHQTNQYNKQALKNISNTVDVDRDFSLSEDGEDGDGSDSSDSSGKKEIDIA